MLYFFWERRQHDTSILSSISFNLILVFYFAFCNTIPHRTDRGTRDGWKGGGSTAGRLKRRHLRKGSLYSNFSLSFLITSTLQFYTALAALKMLSKHFSFLNAPRYTNDSRCGSIIIFVELDSKIKCIKYRAYGCWAREHTRKVALWKQNMCFSQRDKFAKHGLMKIRMYIPLLYRWSRE